MAATQANCNECKSEILSDIGNTLYLNPDLSDVHFLFASDDEDVERVPAHKIFLIAASDDFRVMFNGQWKEKDEVKIVDASVGAFKEFLQFFYTDRVKLTEANINEVFKLAHKYIVTKGLAVCKKFMVNTLTEDNILKQYEVAIQLEQVDLQIALEKVIEINARSILESAEFLKCRKNVVSSILKADMLCTEFELFKACMNWVKVAANQNVLTREHVSLHLGQFFYSFRFGTMTLKEMAEITRLYRDIFSYNEYTDIIQMIADKEYESMCFRSIRIARMEMLENKFDSWKSIVIKCGRKVSSPYEIKNKETTTFSSSDTLLLRSFRLPGIWQRSDSYERVYLSTTVTIEETSPKTNETVLLRERSTYFEDCDCTDSMDPILIKAGSIYHIHFEQQANGKYISNELQTEEVEVQSGITVNFKPSDDNDRSGSLGLINELEFYSLWPLARWKVIPIWTTVGRGRRNQTQHLNRFTEIYFKRLHFSKGKHKNTKSSIEQFKKKSS